MSKISPCIALNMLIDSGVKIQNIYDENMR